MVEGIYQVGDGLGVAGELTAAQLEQACRDGYRSVLNLRQAKEKGFLAEEEAIVTALGMGYVHKPVNPSQLHDDLVEEVVGEMDRLPKPLLVHCSLGLRSMGMAMLYLGKQRGLTASEFLEKATAMGLNFDERPAVKRFFLDYINRHFGG